MVNDNDDAIGMGEIILRENGNIKTSPIYVDTLTTADINEEWLGDIKYIEFNLKRHITQ